VRFPVISLQFLFISCIIGLISGETAHAGIIFSDFGPGNSYAQGGGVIEGSATEEGYAAWGDSFIPSTNYAVTQIDLALLYFSGTNSMIVTLNADDAGLPGAALATWDVTSSPQFEGFPGDYGVQTTLVDAGVELSSETRYWIVVAPGAVDTFGAWEANSIPVGGLVAPDQGSGFVAEMGAFNAFDVLGNPIPEPSYSLATGGGLALMFFGSRGRRGQSKKGVGLTGRGPNVSAPASPN
jgi:hypothetical protein